MYIFHSPDGDGCFTNSKDIQRVYFVSTSFQEFWAIFYEAFFRVAPYENLLSHTRFLLTLRSQEGKYHSLILFRLSTGDDTQLPNVSQRSDLHSYQQLYAMESACPHLEADMSHAEIEECEDSVVVVCPWHRYAIWPLFWGISFDPSEYQVRFRFAHW